jgi:hypothetical protein
MALTVTIEDLKCIFDTDLDDLCLQAFLDDAILLVDHIGAEAECGLDQGNAIAKYLAAHLASHRDRRQIEQSTLEASEKFGTPLDIGLDATVYGQTAKRLDCTGRLSELDKQDKNPGVKPRHIFIACGR